VIRLCIIKNEALFSLKLDIKLGGLHVEYWLEIVLRFPFFKVFPLVYYLSSLMLSVWLGEILCFIVRNLYSEPSINTVITAVS